MLFAVLMIIVVLLNVCGHVFLKIGMIKVGEIGDRSILEFGAAALTNINILIGLTGYVTSVAGYIIVLSKTQLSVAYPILMSSGYALVVLASFLFLREPFNAIKWAGIALIFIGVVLVSLKA